MVLLAPDAWQGIMTRKDYGTPAECRPGAYRPLKALNPTVETCDVCGHAQLIHDDNGKCYGCARTDTAQAVAWARELAASIADDHERALVTGVIDTVTEGRKLPSWRVMTPLMRAAALALQGKTKPWESE